MHPSAMDNNLKKLAIIRLIRPTRLLSSHVETEVVLRDNTVFAFRSLTGTTIFLLQREESLA